MATATNFDAWLDDVDGDYEEVMALYGVSLDIENYCTLGSFFDHQ